LKRQTTFGKTIDQIATKCRDKQEEEKGPPSLMSSGEKPFELGSLGLAHGVVVGL